MGDELVKGPTPGSAFWHLQKVDIPLAADMSLEGLIREALHAPDNKGRLYPRPLGAQHLPKTIRALLFGNSHTEVDLIGSRYQLFQKLSLSLLQIHLPLFLTYVLCCAPACSCPQRGFWNFPPPHPRIFLPFSLILPGRYPTALSRSRILALPTHPRSTS